MTQKIAELLERKCNVLGGTKVLNCVVHISRSLLDRPGDCALCAVDVRNKLSDAIEVNKWLNTWKDDAVAILTAQHVVNEGKK